MNKIKFFSLAILVIIVTSLSCVRANAFNQSGCLSILHQVPLQVGYDNPVGSNPKPHKSPVLLPEVILEDHTLTFDSSCHGLTLQLVNEDGDVEYTAAISSSTLVLPSTLEGEYEIRIICGDHYFYGYIEL